VAATEEGHVQQEVIIGLGFFPDQSRPINRLAAGRSFGEGQVQIQPPQP